MQVQFKLLPIVAVLVSHWAYADYVPPKYYVGSAYIDYGSSRPKEKIFRDLGSACSAVVSYYNKIYGPRKSYALKSMREYGQNYSMDGDRIVPMDGYVKNEGSVNCVMTETDRSGTDTYVMEFIEHNAIRMSSPCFGSYDMDIPSTYAEYNANYDKFYKYGNPVEAHFGTKKSQLKTCGCAGPDGDYKDGRWRQTSNGCVPIEEQASYKPEEKNTSENSGVCGIGNPINPATGAKYLKELDYASSAGEVALKFERQYNSKVDPITPSVGLGWGWRHRYSRSLVFDEADALPRVRVTRPDGGAVVFRQQLDGSYKQDADVNDRLVAIRDGAGAITGYTFTVADGPEGVGVVESYDATGRIQSLKTVGGWQLTFGWSTSATNSDIAPAAGYLISVTDSGGRYLAFEYNSGGQIKVLQDPSGQSYAYSYDDNGNLTSVTNPRQEVRTYHYNEADHIQKEDGTYGTAGEAGHLTNALTGITDEKAVRYADYRYQFDGRGVETTHAAGADKHTLSYAADGSGTTVVDPLNQSRVYKFAVAQGVAQPQDQDQPCSTGSPYKSTKVDGNGNPEYQIDFNNNRTSFVYDTVRNLETSRKEGLTAEGVATAQTRTTTTEWHPSLRLPAKVAQPLKLTTYEYYPSGLLKTRTEQATTDADGSKGLSPTLDTTVPSRSWGYTYNGEGQVLTVDGPRTDVSDITTLTYYPSTDTAAPPKWRKGDVQTAKNAAGHVTTFNEYDAHGNVLKSTDANNVVTVNTYDELGRLKTQSVGGLTTSYTYDARGMLESVSTPQGATLTYGYDDAHRLKTITDRDGARTEYTELDAMGNRKDERVYDAANKLVRQHKRQYNALNRLEQDIGATNSTKQITQYEYYLGGQLKKVTDPLSRITEHTYDALNRLKDSTLPVPQTGVARPVVGYGWDGQDRLASVTDPRTLKTSYTIDGLGNRSKVVSPDAGTQSYTPDEAGNIKSAKDAKLQTTGYTYDALNRVKQVTLHDSSVQVYEYDTATNGKGKLAKITEKDAAGTVVSTLSLTYDSLSRVQTLTRALAGKSLGTSYGYDTQGRLDTVTYPSGRVVKYAYDTSGRVNGVTTTPAGGTAMTVVKDVSYHPFGGIKQYTYGNGQVQKLDVDIDGRPSGYVLGASSYKLDYDVASQLQSITNVGNLSDLNTYGWDGLSRLSSAATPTSSYGYTYDGVGNRSTTTVGGTTTSYGYPTDKNRLTSVGSQAQGFDDNGALKTAKAGSFTHDVRGRLSQFDGAAGTTTYGVDALGLRVRKSNAQGDFLYAYDADGNLLAESTVGGTIVKEYIYLGTRLVAVATQ
ncbi:MAG: hypothetical protein RI907_3501 [Pseudomonadota bacterium]